MLKLSEFMTSKLPDVPLEVIAKVIKARDEYFNMYRGNYCDFCYKELTPEERSSLSVYDFNHTCTEHRQYSAVFDTERVRRELNLNSRFTQVDL